MGFLDSIFGKRGEGTKSQESPAACPYCGIVLDTPPTSSRKCPACGDKIVVRTRRSDGAKLYLTAADAKAFDAERKADAFRNKAIRAAANIGLDKTAFERMQGELLAKSPGYGPGDVFWALANRLSAKQMRGGDWQGLSMTYFHQALWLYETGRPYEQLKVEAEKARAQDYALRGIRQLEIMGGCCDNCGRFQSRIYPIEQALREWPVPVEECTNGWCVCTWLLVVPD